MPRTLPLVKNPYCFFPRTTGLDGAMVRPVLAKPETELSAPERTVRDAVIHGGRMSLKWTALVPLTMAAGYLVLILYFKAKGGYSAVPIGDSKHPIAGSG